MRVSTRIVFTIYIIVVVLLCLFLLGTMYGLIPSDNLALAVKTVIKGGLEYKVIYTIIFAAMAVIGVILIFTATRKKRSYRYRKQFGNRKRPDIQSGCCTTC